MYILSFKHYCVAGEAVLCVAHGTSLRGIVKHIEQLSDEEICSLDLPNGIPIVYRSGHGYRWIIVTTVTSAVKRSIGSTTGCTITEKAPTRARRWLA